MQFDPTPILHRLHPIIALACLSLLIGGCNPGGESDPQEQSTDSAATHASTPDARSDAKSDETSSREELADALRVADPLVRIERVSRFLQHASFDQLADVKATFENAALDNGDLEYVLFIEWWAKFNPRTAFKYSMTGEVRAEHGRLQAAAARAWTRKDPQAAVDTGYFYNTQSPDHSYSTELLDAVVVGWFESGKPGLEEFLSKLTAVSDVTRGMRTYARMRVLRDGARETLEWTREPSPFPKSHQRLLLAGALTIIAHQDPQLAIEWIPIAKADGIDTSTFLMRIAGSWAHHDPEATLEWVSTLPDDFERSSAARRAANRWHDSDPKAYAAWLSKQVGDASLDPARVFTIQTDVNRAPLDVDWPDMVRRTQEVVDEAARKPLMLWVLQHWSFLGPEDAKAWIAAHSEEFTKDEVEAASQISLGDKRKIERAVKEQREAEAAGVAHASS